MPSVPHNRNPKPSVSAKPATLALCRIITSSPVRQKPMSNAPTSISTYSPCHGFLDNMAESLARKHWARRFKRSAGRQRGPGARVTVHPQQRRNARDVPTQPVSLLNSIHAFPPYPAGCTSFGLTSSKGCNRHCADDGSFRARGFCDPQQRRNAHDVHTTRERFSTRSMPFHQIPQATQVFGLTSRRSNRHCADDGSFPRSAGSRDPQQRRNARDVHTTREPSQLDPCLSTISRRLHKFWTHISKEQPALCRRWLFPAERGSVTRRNVARQSASFEQPMIGLSHCRFWFEKARSLFSLTLLRVTGPARSV